MPVEGEFEQCLFLGGVGDEPGLRDPGEEAVELRRRIRELPVRQEIPQARRGHDLGRFVAALAILGPP